VPGCRRGSPQGVGFKGTITASNSNTQSFAVDSAGTITVDAALDYNVQNFYTLEATATDTEGNTSVAATVEVYVSESTIPQASSTARTTLHDLSLTDTIVYDATDEDADPLTFVIDTLPANGTLYDGALAPLSLGQSFDGNFTFEPAFSFVGADGFNWHANDGDNDSNVATLSIDVYNTKPQAWDGWYGLTVDSETSGDLNGNAYDEDATLWPDMPTYTVQTLPAHGTLYAYYSSPLSAGQSFDGLWQYFPNPGFVGDDSFEFFASDSIEDGNVATIYFDVAPYYNAGPLTANDDVSFTERGTPVNIAVLNNDGSNQGMLSIADVTQGAHGTVWTDTVEIAYTPTDPLFYGHDTFQYQVEDGTGASLWATVDVYVYWIDLDVDNNGSLLDAEDGTENYLPGYVGEDDVLSTGTEFSDWHYLGQQMRVIVEGIGSDSDVQQVTFQLLDVTNYEGYSENTSDPAIEGAGQDNDLSFSQFANQDLGFATIEQNRSWTPLWAKDYGADANIQVSFQVGMVTAGKTIAAFKDEENGGAGDGIPDKWEEAMVTEWNARYGTSIPVNNAFFGHDDDKEPKDPDRPGAVFQSPNANGNVSISDIRPDRSSGTVTVAFVNAVSPSGLIISTSTSGSNITITVELADNATGITSTADLVIAELNSNLTTQNVVFAEATSGMGGGKVTTVAATALQKNFLAHKTAGDSLKVYQELRGFVFDGGPGAAGVVGPIPIRTPLSPAKKELLVEVDVMKDIKLSFSPTPSSSDYGGIMTDVSNGFRATDHGVGIDVYWVLDTTAGPHKAFANHAAAALWATPNRHPRLKSEFVHLMFIEDAIPPASSGVVLGFATNWGAFVEEWPTDAAQKAKFPTKDFKKILAQVAAHELTHLLLNTISSNGFDAKEHVENPDPTDPPKSPKDFKYLMYSPENAQNVDQFIFSNPTIGQINLKDKESVERT
jgi:Bacterial Ig domain